MATYAGTTSARTRRNSRNCWWTRLLYGMSSPSPSVATAARDRAVATRWCLPPAESNRLPYPNRCARRPETCATSRGAKMDRVVCPRSSALPEFQAADQMSSCPPRHRLEHGMDVPLRATARGALRLPVMDTSRVCSAAQTVDAIVCEAESDLGNARAAGNNV